ncbi:MAG TPA: hypothetical protein VNL74_05335 [Methylococcus sp.]|nr:hypothetical protein [Methylococcus sp.]
MTKREFIQRLIIRSQPAIDRFDLALAYAEALWERLTARGYGVPKRSEPREPIDWYGKLQGQNKIAFDRFWDAYGHKKDRNGAAMRWCQLGDLPRDEVEQIIEAARIDARQWRETAQPGQIRKMAQGWLFERRWLDHSPCDKRMDDNRDKDAELRGLRQKLSALKRLQEAGPSEEIKRQIDELVRRIGNFSRKG